MAKGWTHLGLCLLLSGRGVNIMGLLLLLCLRAIAMEYMNDMADGVDANKRTFSGA